LLECDRPSFAQRAPAAEASLQRSTASRRSTNQIEDRRRRFEAVIAAIIGRRHRAIGREAEARVRDLRADGSSAR